MASDLTSDSSPGFQQFLSSARKDLQSSGLDRTVSSLDDALTKLAVEHEDAARVVELRFFAGLTEEETASALDISRSTVRRDWDYARAWLLAELTD